MTKWLLKILKWCGIIITIIIATLICIILFAKYNIHSTSPKKPSIYIEQDSLIKHSNRHFSYGKNWAKKNDFGIWEVSIEGNAFERGLAYGKLIKEPIQNQEEVFVNSINKVIPSKFYQSILKNLIYIFHFNINDYVSKEVKNEILGVSLSFSSKYDYIGKKYLRVLAYHAAHDLGHALNNYAMIGCTSFSTWGKKTKDGNIIHARNFDFYFGEDFAKEKVILIVHPDSGNAFISYSWPGMMGVVSGMNEKGLAVTINASMSDPPTSASLPISLLVREVLQFTENLEEAIDYISDREIFVSESIMISSAIDKKTIIVEKTPSKQGVFTTNDLILCSNHFQSEPFINDSTNIINIRTTDSNKRFKRMSELLAKNEVISLENAISILRDKKGFGEKNIGLGSPHAINQLLAHHAVVFEPEKLNVWISSSPYQIGEFLCYNLNTLLSEENTIAHNNFSEIIPKDSFVNSNEYLHFKEWKKMRSNIMNDILYNTSANFDSSKFITLNKESYETYLILGKYYLKQKRYKDAEAMFNLSLTKDLPFISLEKEINNYILLCSSKK